MLIRRAGAVFDEMVTTRFSGKMFALQRDKQGGTIARIQGNGAQRDSFSL
jgi:hypothetical protein